MYICIIRIKKYTYKSKTKKCFNKMLANHKSPKSFHATWQAFYKTHGLYWIEEQHSCKRFPQLVFCWRWWRMLSSMSFGYCKGWNLWFRWLLDLKNRASDHSCQDRNLCQKVFLSISSCLFSPCCFDHITQCFKWYQSYEVISWASQKTAQHANDSSYLLMAVRSVFGSG